MSVPFDILLDAEARLVEIVYPARPTADEVEDYIYRVRTVIDGYPPGGWLCLVDQRNVLVMSPDLVDKVRVLNVYAVSRGMLRSARVVATAVAGLQASRMAREGSLGIEVQTFDTREAAVAWLTSTALPGPRARR